MIWPRVEIEHRPCVGVRVPACSPRVVIDRDEIRLAVPEKMPLPALVFAIGLSLFAIAFAMMISYFLPPEFPGGPAGAWALGGAIAFFAVAGVLGGFIGGWYMGKAKGPLAVHRLGSGEIEFPHTKMTLKRDDILGMDYVIGGYYWKQASTGWGRGPLCQLFCRVRDGNEEKRVIVHSDSVNYMKRWRAFAREVGLRVERQELPRRAWPRME